ncbi:MAG: Fe-Mn family superoxide dismutase [Candidatus Pacearchaeota archaeon]|nr:Fe-Mn family superoxide dismutase [Candidatus Pacearchaeota archaeon]
MAEAIKMTYQPKNFDHLIGISGFSEQLLKNHFTLYQGYVNNTNKLIEEMAILDKDNKTQTIEFSELKRRFGWEFNGMKLHEYYFENLTKNFVSLDKNSNFYKEITKQFGSYEAWERHFKSCALIRGIGWLILFYDKTNKKFITTWVNEHNTGVLLDCVPLFVLDLFEHAYMLDYGLKRADYVEAFFKVIDWKVVVKRFNSIII